MKYILLAALIPVAVLFGIPTAHADEAHVNYEIMLNGKRVVCGYFDTQGVTPTSINTIGQFYLNKGFTPAESAEIVSTSVRYFCKQYLPALNVTSSINSGGGY